jgi:hypothetical protein
MYPFISNADIGFAIGLNFTYEGDVGVTVKALSNDKNEKWLFAVGSSYYPFSENKIGLDFGFGGSNFNIVGLIGIDILQDASYLSIGYANMSNTAK